MVFDLLHQLFYLMGGWPEWRVEDPGALTKEREGERKVNRECVTLRETVSI